MSNNLETKRSFSVSRRKGTRNEHRSIVPGTMVRLKSCPSGTAGVVEGTRRHRIVVRWPSEGYVGKHAPALGRRLGFVRYY